MRAMWSNFVVGAFVVMLAAIAFNFLPKSLKAEQESAERVELSDGVSVEKVAAALKQRQKAIEDREEYLSEWEERLRIQEKSVKERVDELQALLKKQNEYEEMLKQRQEKVEERLVQTFEKMKPRKAAEVLTVMEDRLAVELLMAMKANKVAGILDKMDSNRAMLLSAEIATARKPAAEE